MCVQNRTVWVSYKSSHSLHFLSTHVSHTKYYGVILLYVQKGKVQFLSGRSGLVSEHIVHKCHLRDITGLSVQTAILHLQDILNLCLDCPSSLFCHEQKETLCSSVVSDQRMYFICCCMSKMV
jgi:hypothetical protein